MTIVLQPVEDLPGGDHADTEWTPRPTPGEPRDRVFLVPRPQSRHVHQFNHSLPHTTPTIDVVTSPIATIFSLKCLMVSPSGMLPLLFPTLPFPAIRRYPWPTAGGYTSLGTGYDDVAGTPSDAAWLHKQPAVVG